MTFTLSGTYNFRDLGGLPLTDGGATRSGVLFRSDALTRLTDDDRTRLGETTDVIVDLRADAERATAPDRLPDGARVVELPLIEGAFAADAALPSLPSIDGVYAELVADGSAAFSQIATLLAAGDRTLVHCTAGKDRTGVAIAVLLDAVGVRRDAILDDYSASERNLAGEWATRMLAGITAMGVTVTPEIERLVTASPRSAMETVLARIDDEHGGSADYLDAAGFDGSGLAELRARLRD